MRAPLNLSGGLIIGVVCAFVASALSRYCGTQRTSPSSRVSAGTLLENPYGRTVHNCSGSALYDIALLVSAVAIVPLILGIIVETGERFRLASIAVMGAVPPLAFVTFMTQFRGRSGSAWSLEGTAVAAIGALAALSGSWLQRRRAVWRAAESDE